MLRSHAMTIGQLSRRTSVPIKVLRKYEGLGFLSTLGRSESNYRLFSEEAVWCVQVIGGLRSLGLTLKEIQALITCSQKRPGEPISVLLDESLARALARVEVQMATLQALRQRILDFQAARTGAPAHSAAFALVQVLARDPRALCVAPCYLPLDSLTRRERVHCSQAPQGGEKKTKPSQDHVLGCKKETGGLRQDERRTDH